MRNQRIASLGATAAAATTMCVIFVAPAVASASPQASDTATPTSDSRSAATSSDSDASAQATSRRTAENSVKRSEPSRSTDPGTPANPEPDRPVTDPDDHPYSGDDSEPSTPADPESDHPDDPALSDDNAEDGQPTAQPRLVDRPRRERHETKLDRPAADIGARPAEASVQDATVDESPAKTAPDDAPNLAVSEPETVPTPAIQGSGSGHPATPAAAVSIDDPTQKTPARAPSLFSLVRSLALNVVNGFAHVANVPAGPAPAPVPAPQVTTAAWTLLGAARRDPDVPAANTVQTDATGQPVNTQSDETAPRVLHSTATQDPLGDQAALYTGQPSFIQQVVKAGLYVLKAVLKPFGGLLAFTSLKVPLFTDGIPPFFLTSGLKVERSEFEGMKVWTLTPRTNATEKTVVALHGGAYMATASIFHWWTYADMARDTGATIVVPLQTLIPAGGTAASEVPRTANFITKVIDERGAQNVSVIGDSAGGNLAMAAMQELVRRNSQRPSRLVLISPWLDVSMSDPRSAQINDPLLDLANPTKAGMKWAGTAGTQDPQASPLFGSLNGLPPTYVYSSSLDLITVDTLRLRDRVLAENIPGVTFRLRNGLIHDWFTFPFLPDAREDRPSVYQDLLGTDAPANDLAPRMTA